MSENDTNAPAISQTHRAALEIGEKLATTTNQHSLHTRGLQPILKFGPNWNNQWTCRRADLQGAVDIARHALFGMDQYANKIDGVALAPTYDADTGRNDVTSDKDSSVPRVRLDTHRTEIRHPFWDAFEPSTRLADDWQLLTGHMQRIHLELMSRMLVGEDPRPALMRIAAMKPAIETVLMADSNTSSRPYHLRRSHHYLVMQNWSRDRAEAVKQIRAFLKEHATTRCTVKQDPENSDVYLIKPTDSELIHVPHNDYLAVNETTGAIIVLTRADVAQMER